jgi:hypothetical protein
MEAIAQAGRQAEELLASPAFIATMNDLSQLHLTALVAAEPTPSTRETRDFHHTLLHALQELETQIRTRISFGQEMAERLGYVDEDSETE